MGPMYWKSALFTAGVMLLLYTILSLDRPCPSCESQGSAHFCCVAASTPACVLMANIR